MIISKICSFTYVFDLNILCIRGGGEMEMFKNIMCALGVVVFVIGLCAVYNRLLLLTVRPRCGENAVTVIILDGEMRSPAAVISYYLSVYSVSGGIGQMKLLCVDRGLSEHSLQLLKEVFRREKHVVFVTEEEFFGFFTQKK